jgi:hypothetical protein
MVYKYVKKLYAEVCKSGEALLDEAFNVQLERIQPLPTKGLTFNIPAFIMLTTVGDGAKQTRHPQHMFCFCFNL